MHVVHHGDDDDDDTPAVAAPVHGSGGSGISEAFLSDKLWTDKDIAPLLSAATRRALAEAFGFHRMSKVQAASLAMLLRGDDCFAKAKTGGGKTLAFLLPAVERLIALRANSQPNAVGVLVISPTRELALQILEEAKTLVRFHAGPLHVEAVIGGTNISSERKRMHGHGSSVSVDILVATPGRCVDHIESTPGFAAALRNVRVLVLDEADRLLDMGFEASLNQISRMLPPGAPPPAGPMGERPPGRQSLLFSATVPEPVKAVAHRFLRTGYPLIDTVGANETATNPQVTQEAMVLPPTSVIPALAAILGHIATTNPHHKTVVFFTTARLTGYMASVFANLSFRNPRGGPDIKLNVIEMHSRKSQSYRTSASEKFRVGSGVVMFSSDVSARGMDYPGITEVIQVGLTDREQYIHRLGRTARAGREGAGLLLLADFEARALLQELHDLPITPAGPTSDISGGVAAGLPPYAVGVPATPARGRADFLARFPVSAPVPPPATLGFALARVARSEDDLREASQAYGAMLGFYNGAQRRLGWSAETMVETMNMLFLTLGCPEVPVMPKDTLGKMGLRGVAGIREGPSLRGGSGRGGSGGGNGGSGRRGGGGGGGRGRF